MAFPDLRAFIASVEQFSTLRRVSGADPHLELGGITEIAAGLVDTPALLFDDLKGFSRGFRVFTNPLMAPERAALALGIDPRLRPLDALRAWMRKRQQLKPIRPVEVKQAEFLENSSDGDDVDLARIPAPVWHRDDGGPYIGSGSIVILRDPDTGWITASIYRVQVHTRNRVTVQFDHLGRHGAIIAKKYWDAGKSCPIAVVNGDDPALFVAGFESLPLGVGELDFAGGIREAPVEIVPGPHTGLPIPAHAEIVLEGELIPMADETLPEGPFGEFTGYYAADQRPGAIMAVRALHYRNDPILLGSPPLKPPRFHVGLPFRAGGIWANLEAANITDIAGVWQHVSSLMTVVSLKQRYDGHAKRAAMIAAGNAYMGRIVVVVDDDIDPSNMNDVMWAIATRCEPAEAVDIVRNGWSSSLDPRIAPSDKARGVTSNSKLILDATRPYAWRDEFPKPSALSIDEARAIEEKWLGVLRPG
ncbi:MAG: UbiD family decarboxylase [Betaproteobacteria bacterium]|nr:UbiD family decarboxylase [Betaproteobacteria bacterium]